MDDMAIRGSFIEYDSVDYAQESSLSNISAEFRKIKELDEAVNAELMS